MFQHDACVQTSTISWSLWNKLAKIKPHDNMLGHNSESASNKTPEIILKPKPSDGQVQISDWNLIIFSKCKRLILFFFKSTKCYLTNPFLSSFICGLKSYSINAYKLAINQGGQWTFYCFDGSQKKVCNGCSVIAINAIGL